jgi:hypothetical protein
MQPAYTGGFERLEEITSTANIVAQAFEGTLRRLAWT